jgi:hypothetical protein
MLCIKRTRAERSEKVNNNNNITNDYVLKDYGPTVVLKLEKATSKITTTELRCGLATITATLMSLSMRHRRRNAPKVVQFLRILNRAAGGEEGQQRENGICRQQYPIKTQ